MDYKEKVIALLNSKELSKEQNEKLESIFPELRESEDEKIRKELIIYLRSVLSNKKYGDKFIESWIAWLEKQQKPIKEHDVCDFCDEKHGCVSPCPTKLIEEQKTANNVEPKFKIGDKIVEKDFDECGCGTIIDIKDGKYIFDDGGFICIEEQGLWKLVEKKPVDKVDQHSLPVSDNSSLPTFEESIYHPCTEELYEQTPTKWSEDDELHIRELESLVKRVWAIAEHENDKETIHKMSDLSFFLKTLKPQLKQEWSEEDENTLLDTINILCSCGKCSTDRKLWLLSLRNRIQPKYGRSHTRINIQ